MRIPLFLGLTIYFLFLRQLGVGMILYLLWIDIDTSIVAKQASFKVLIKHLLLKLQSSIRFIILDHPL